MHVSMIVAIPVQCAMLVAMHAAMRVAMHAAMLVAMPMHVAMRVAMCVAMRVAMFSCALPCIDAMQSDNAPGLFMQREIQHVYQLGKLGPKGPLGLFQTFSHRDVHISQQGLLESLVLLQDHLRLHAFPSGQM